MLELFRKYQRSLYLVVTFMIVISFSFFGTYSGMQGGGPVDKTVFQAVDGSSVLRSELEEMAAFIGTDQEDKMLLGGRWGPNFLNDGVIRKDFLETGMAEILAAPFLEEMRSELQTRQQREKLYHPYRHPQAQFISAENAWNAVIPELNKRLNEMRKIEDPSSKEAFDARVKVYLTERRFPHPALRMLLTRQQKQYQWVSEDPNLNYIDLSLFGYHTADDWFGTRFVRLVSEFIINSAIIAKEQGYSVSKEEALADLYRNAELSFRHQSANPNSGAANAGQYFEEQLRRMGMDANRATAIWQKVMLFRRLFHDVGGSVWVDPYTFANFQNFAKQSVAGTLYQLPEGLRLGDFRDLQRFEVYLSAVSDRTASGPKLLELPKQWKSADQVAAQTPELVERRYVLKLAQVNKKHLQAKVGVKETWDWQVQEGSWKKLKEQFPELGVKPGETEQERFASLESLDQKTRRLVDAYSRGQIVEEHPEWLDQALSEAELVEMPIGIRQKGKNKMIVGLANTTELISLLDQYPQSQKELEKFSADNQTYYRIAVKEKPTKNEVLSFAEVKEDGTLDQLVDAKLEAVYPDLRADHPQTFRKGDEGWKPFDQVKQKVAELYFADVLQAINQSYASDGKKQEMLPDFAATLRFYAPMQNMLQLFKDHPETIEEHVIDNGDREIFADQWKLQRRPYVGDRGTPDLPMDESEAFSLQPGDWTAVKKRANGSLAFFQLSEQQSEADRAGIVQKVMGLQLELSDRAQGVYMQTLVEQFREKNALTLQYLNPVQESEG